MFSLDDFLGTFPGYFPKSFPGQFLRDDSPGPLMANISGRPKKVKVCAIFQIDGSRTIS